MVAQGRGIIAEFAHQFEFQFPSVKVEIGSALEDVPGIEEQGIGVLFADTVHQGGPTGHSSHIRKLWMGFGKGIDMAVHIIGVQDRDMLLAKIGTGSQRESSKSHHGRCRGRSGYKIPPLHHSLSWINRSSTRALRVSFFPKWSIRALRNK